MKSFPVFVSGDSVWSPVFSFVWYCVPKAASRSLLRAFTVTQREAFKGVKFKDMKDFSPQSPRLPDNVALDDCTTFACVRNPLTRIASLWFEKFRNYDGSVGKQKMFRRYRHLSHDLSFSDFADWLLSSEGSDDRADAHWRSQADFVCVQGGASAVDHLCRIETIERDLSAIIARLQAPSIDLGRLNSNQERVDRMKGGPRRSPSLYRELLTSKNVEKLVARYTRDFELLGYDPKDLALGRDLKSDR